MRTQCLACAGHLPTLKPFHLALKTAEKAGQGKHGGFVKTKKKIEPKAGWGRAWWICEDQKEDRAGNDCGFVRPGCPLDCE